MPDSSNKSPAIAGLGDLAPAYDAIFCDIWGVVHNGRNHFAEACQALSRFRKAGGVVVLVTNAPRPNQSVHSQLDTLGVPLGCFDDIVTSGDVTLSLIAERGNDPIYHIGPSRDLVLFEILKSNFGCFPPLSSLDSASYVVCTGLFDDRAETPADYDGTLERMLVRRLDMISANPDMVVHVGDHEVYCSGAIAARYEEMGGHAIQAGKPFAPIYEQARRLAEAHAHKPIIPERILAIGDGLLTDVKGAQAQGLDCVFITSGVHRNELHANGATDAVALDRLLEAAKVRPMAALPSLVW